jgi:hypothetical protein
VFFRTSFLHGASGTLRGRAELTMKNEAVKRSVLQDFIPSRCIRDIEGQSRAHHEE